MVGYRLYFMERFSGHIETRSEFEADDDAAAIQLAATLANGKPMELWERGRKIQRWEATTLPANPTE